MNDFGVGDNRGFNIMFRFVMTIIIIGFVLMFGFYGVVGYYAVKGLNDPNKSAHEIGVILRNFKDGLEGN